MNTNEILIQELLKNRAKTPADLAVSKRKIAKKYKITCPSNIVLLRIYHKIVKNKTLLRPAFAKASADKQGYGGRRNKKIFENLERLFRTRPIRSLSGIVNVSVLTKSYPCPGKCLYCPQESGIPKSYVSGEPAVERAKRLNFDPYLQVKKRIEMLKIEGHPTDKIELRIVGGTWSYYPKKYQIWFIKRCFDACNKRKGSNLKEAQRLNERAEHRVVGLSIETRPDFINISEIKRLRELGATMVELGVQSIYDDILKLNARGHGVKETILATKLLKDAGFKVLYQMMPNLPGSNLKKDEKMFKELFQNPDFQPDLLKIYPCALLKETPLYKLWKTGKYKPYTQSQLINLIKKIKQKIPYYVRIQRITRDIPSRMIIAGPAKISNLRQILAEKMKREGWKCKCIRCQEIRENYLPSLKASEDKLIQNLKLFRQDYNASDGKEIFLSFCATGASATDGENPQRYLYSLLRLRITSQNTAIIREIHTYGPQLPIIRGSTSIISPQHKGLGKKLIREAEKISKKVFGFHPIKSARGGAKQFNRVNKIAVISAIGAREYFRKLGYRLKDTYMVKNL